MEMRSTQIKEGNKVIAVVRKELMVWTKAKVELWRAYIKD